MPGDSERLSRAAASVQAIAEPCGVAAGTLYRYLPSKADLFVELVREATNRDISSSPEAEMLEFLAICRACNRWGSSPPLPLIAADVNRGLVTREGARRYGVVLDENLRVDLKPTLALREEMARKRGTSRMFDFGGSMEELKARCKEETGFDPPVSPSFATWVRSRQQKLSRLPAQLGGTFRATPIRRIAILGIATPEIAEA